MRFVDKKFYISTINGYSGKFVVSLFKRMVSKEIRGFNKVLNSSKILDIELEVFNVGRAAVTMGQSWLYVIRDE